MNAERGQRNGRALQGSAPTVAVTPARAPLAAQESTLPAVTWEVTMLHGADDFDTLLARIRENDGEPLVCPCNDDPYGNGPCRECQAAIDASLIRRGLKAPPPDYEARDVEDDQC